MSKVLINHLGQTVSDIVKIRRFYEELFGFKFWWELDVPDDLASRALMLPPPCKLKATYLWRPDLVLEFLHFGDPSAQRAYEARTLNAPGLTHLAISVENASRLLEQVVAYGGEVIEHSRGQMSEWSQAVFIRDPNGQLIEIVTMHWRDKLPPPPDKRASAREMIAFGQLAQGAYVCCSVYVRSLALRK